MVQSISENFNRPIYNGVKINIKKPEVNAGNQTNTIVNDNGIYNAVSIDIDNPSVNTSPKQVYDYPQNNELITYDMFKPQLPFETKSAIAYHTTNIILPKIENEVELELESDKKEIDNTEENELEEIENFNEDKKNNNETNLNQPNYVEIKKNDNSKINNSNDKDVEIIKQRPEIVPAEEIKPEVDMPKVLENLSSANYDTQALQMEEIVKLAKANDKKLENYITRDVVDNLIQIINKNTDDLEKPTPEQLELRDKLMVNITVENANRNEKQEIPVPYNLSEEDLMNALELSEFELAARNKEYALTTLAVLLNTFITEVKENTGEVVPFEEIPGGNDIINTLKYDTNIGVKIAAIDSLSHIYQPEYHDKINNILSMAANDNSLEVANTAKSALEKISNKNNN